MDQSDKPQVITWGIHQGMHGTKWLELHGNGKLFERTYVPNQAGKTNLQQLTDQPPETFIRILSLINAFAENATPEKTPPPSGYQITLEYTGSSENLNWTFSPAAVSENSTLNQLAAHFAELANQPHAQ